MACGIMKSIILEPDIIDAITERSRIRTFLIQTFIYSLLWSIGGNIVDAYREFFEVYVKEQFDQHPEARLDLIKLFSLNKINSLIAIIVIHLDYHLLIYGIFT